MEKKKGWILNIVIVAIVVILVALGGKDSSSKRENYNDNTTTHQILAKNYLKDYLKDSLHDAKSYEEVSYSSDFNSQRGCYEVTLKYRAKNLLGAYVLEQISGDVYFVDNTVSVRNVRKE